MSLIRYNPKNALKRRGWTEPDFFRSWIGSDILNDFWNTSLWNDHNIAETQVQETEENYLVRVEVPGYDKDEVKAEISDGLLTIKAEHKEEKKGKVNWQVNGSYYVQLALPEYLSTDKANADLKDGILVVDIPKREKEVTRIKITDGK